MKQLILIHGALGGGDQMKPLLKLLEADFDTHILEFDGHGRKAAAAAPYSLESFQSQLEYLIAAMDDQVHIFGYSMGGFVALLTAAKGNDRIRSITTLGTKMRWNPEIAAQETRHLNVEKIQEKVPQFAEALAQRHGVHWEDVLRRTADFMEALGEQQPIRPSRMDKIQVPVQLCLADGDAMVSEEETREVEQWIAKGTFTWLSNSKHPIEQVDLMALAHTIKSFIL